MAQVKKKLVLNAFVEMCMSGHQQPRPTSRFIALTREIQVAGTSPRVSGGTRKMSRGVSTRSPTGWSSPRCLKRPSSTAYSSRMSWVSRQGHRLPDHEVADLQNAGGYDVYQGNLDAAITSGAQWPVNEPLAVVSAMAAVTRSLGFGVTVSTTYEQPFHLARRLSTADHLSGGR